MTAELSAVYVYAIASCAFDGNEGCEVVDSSSEDVLEAVFCVELLERAHHTNEVTDTRLVDVLVLDVVFCTVLLERGHHTTILRDLSVRCALHKANARSTAIRATTPATAAAMIGPKL